MSDFILSGSQRFDLIAGMSQPLAGRVGRIELLPLSAAERAIADRLPHSLEQVLWQGAYPAHYDRPMQPGDWFANYVATYVERDVRQLVAVRELGLFQRFVRMCADRSGQLLNLTALGVDCGISAFRHFGSDGARVAGCARNQLSRRAAGAIPPEFRQAPGQSPEALFSRH